MNNSSKPPAAIAEFVDAFTKEMARSNELMMLLANATLQNAKTLELVLIELRNFAEREETRNHQMVLFLDLLKQLSSGLTSAETRAVEAERAATELRPYVVLPMGRDQC